MKQVPGDAAAADPELHLVLVLALTVFLDHQLSSSIAFVSPLARMHLPVPRATMIHMLPMQTMHHHHHQYSSSSKKEATTAPLPDAVVKDGAGASLVVKVVGDRHQGDRPVAAAAACRREAAAEAESAAVDVCLAAAAMAGAALLAWWAVAFHPSYARLWMVPLGLVLAGTPPVVCLALRFSSDSDSRAPATTTSGGKGSSGSAAGAPPPLLVDVVVHK